MAQGSARRLSAPQEPTNVALYQVRAFATHVPTWGAIISLGKAKDAHSLWCLCVPTVVVELVTDLSGRSGVLGLLGKQS